MMDPCKQTHTQNKRNEKQPYHKILYITHKYTAGGRTTVLKGCNTAGLIHHTQLILISCLHTMYFIFISINNNMNVFMKTDASILWILPI